jgi:hypothetical protein
MKKKWVYNNIISTFGTTAMAYKQRRIRHMNKKIKILLTSFLSFCFLLPFLSSASPLEEELQKLRKAGIPTTIEELNLPKIPDEKNARFLYEKAEKLQNSLRERDRKIWETFPSYAVPIGKKITEEKERESIDYILNNPEFNRLCGILEKAVTMECRFFDKSIYIDNKEGLESLQTFTAIRVFARILADKAKIEAEYGDVSKALKSALTGLRLGDSLSNEPRSIAVLSQTGLDSITIENLQDVVEKISVREKKNLVADVSIYQQIIRNISRKRDNRKVNQLIVGSTLDARLSFSHYKGVGKEIFELSEFEKKIIEMLRRQEEYREKEKKEMGEEKYKKLYGETIKVPTAKEFETGHRKEKALLKEEFSKSGMEDVEDFIEQQEVLYLSLMNRIIPLLQKTYYETKDELNKIFKDIERETEKRYTLRYIANPTSIQRMLMYCLKDNALAGAVEIGIANVIFRKQNGRYINELSELIPKILSALPIDPFTGKNYIYRKTDTGFIVYSVGENMRDDGGIDRYSKEGKEKGSTDIIWEIN